MATYNNTYFEYYFDNELIKGYLNTVTDIVADEEDGDTFQFTSSNPLFVKYTGNGILTIPYFFTGDDFREMERFTDVFLDALEEFEDNNNRLLEL
jgi:hypothetical protein